MYKIYIAGPYSNGDVAVNVKTAMDIANELIKLGFAPYCPHLTHFQHLVHPQLYKKWLELDNEWVVVCDGLLRFNGISPGADKEVELALKHHIPVFYSIETLLIRFLQTTP